MSISSQKISLLEMLYTTAKSGFPKDTAKLIFGEYHLERALHLCKNSSNPLVIEEKNNRGEVMLKLTNQGVIYVERLRSQELAEAQLKLAEKQTLFSKNMTLATSVLAMIGLIELAIQIIAIDWVPFANSIGWFFTLLFVLCLVFLSSMLAVISVISLFSSVKRK